MCWSFYCVNDNIEIDLENTQIMCCILCYQELVIGINSRTLARKGLISYYKNNGITSLKKHVDVKHFVIVKMFEEEINSLLKAKFKKKTAKKITIVSYEFIFIFFYQRFL